MTNAIREALARLLSLQGLDEYDDGMIMRIAEQHKDDYYRVILAARTALASLEQASTPSVEAVAWFKHGPYEGDEPLVCVFDDPHDEDCYTPLYTQPPIPAPESAEPLTLWRAICDEAECVVQRGVKCLVLTEEMTDRLGAAIERVLPNEAKRRVLALREQLLDEIDECPGLTMAQDKWLSDKVRENFADYFAIVDAGEKS